MLRRYTGYRNSRFCDQYLNFHIVYSLLVIKLINKYKSGVLHKLLLCLYILFFRKIRFPCYTGDLQFYVIDLFRGACAVKGNVQVAGHVKPAPFSRRDVTLGDVDGSLFHIKI